MSIRSYQYLFERLTQKAGVRKLNFRALRHTFATLSIQNGTDIKTVSTTLGHATAAYTLDIYTHITEDTLKNSVQHMCEKIKLFG